MTRSEPKPVRHCAVYTRVSTDSGLEQDFNSLDNQRESCEAYVKSQALEGWRLLKDRFDDGGFSGGSMERPALQNLLNRVRAKQIDVIVVYKVDRLTRSLADFAKLVELFDANGVSFISVTQAFNTTTSMGRLTLNMLLSFAQFEREITGERIRDKIAASKKKGIWMGGVVPLGYRVENRALHIVEEHATFVRDLFRRYLELGSVVRLHAALEAERIKVPTRQSKAGAGIGGGRFFKGPIYWMLSNPIYIGKLRHRGLLSEGLHEPIVDRATWDRVQAKLHEQTQARREASREGGWLLSRKLYDDNGNPMSPSHASRGSRQWRYYVSRPVLAGHSDKAGSVVRVPAPAIERFVVDALRERLYALPLKTFETQETGIHFERQDLEAISQMETPALLQRPELVERLGGLVERVTIRRSDVEIVYSQRSPDAALGGAILLPWSIPRGRRRREIIAVDSPPTVAKRVMRRPARETFERNYLAARRWLVELERDANTSIQSIATREGKSVRSIRLTLSLAFLAPALATAAITGQLPRGFNVARLADAPMLWSQQWKEFGLSTTSNSAGALAAEFS